MNKIKEMITYIKDKNHESKKKNKNYNTLNTMLESADTIVIIGATSTSITSSITGFGLIILPVAAGIACFLSLGNKVLHKIIVNKHIKHKKNNIRKIKKLLNILINYTDNLYKIINDKNEYESLCKIFTKYVEDT